jgi:hypothetical protein
LSSLYTPGFHSIINVPYLTLWLPFLFCAWLSLSSGFVILCSGY